MPDTEVSSFAVFLQQHRKGGLLSELSDSLHELTEAVTEHNKPGSLTITMKMKPEEYGSDQVVVITDDIKVKAPNAPRAQAMWFVTDDHNLSRDSPSQLSFASLHDVNADLEPDSVNAQEASNQ